MKRLYEGNLSELIDTIRCDKYIYLVTILKFHPIRTSFDRRNFRYTENATNMS